LVYACRAGWKVYACRAGWKVKYHIADYAGKIKMVDM
jgi:hypothetical protein